MQPLAPHPGEPDAQLAARVLAAALDEEIDIRDLAARAWETPEEVSLGEVQVLSAYLVAKNAPHMPLWDDA